MDFREAEGRYDALKQQYRNGYLSAEQLDAQLKEIMVQDRDGNWWSKHAESGEWHYFDGSRWVQHDPPDYEHRAPPPARDEPQAQAYRPPTPGREPPTAGGQARIPTATAEGIRAPGATVPDYLMPLSILSTLFCCIPTGIAAIVYSSQAKSKSEAGDTAGASEATGKAQMWLIISVVLGILTLFIAFASGLAGATPIASAGV